MAQKHHIDYRYSAPAQPIRCYTDADKVEKILFNLLSNAFKYTPDNGNIIISGRTTDNEVEISISDTGSGIAKNDVSQIFARFFQANNQKPGEYSSPGTGIGLALSKTIVEKHHGTITVDSTLGKGSTFTITI